MPMGPLIRTTAPCECGGTMQWERALTSRKRWRLECICGRAGQWQLRPTVEASVDAHRRRAEPPPEPEIDWHTLKLKAETELLELKCHAMRDRLKPESESDFDGRVRRAANMARQSFAGSQTAEVRETVISYMETLLLTTIGKNN